MNIPFDPVKRAKKVEKSVMKDSKRKYYRFRFAPYYGGIVTADAVGCCFLCAYCWNYYRNLRPEEFGYFYSSEEVARKMLNLAEKRNCGKFRISGAEPILGKASMEHLVDVIRILKNYFRNLEFILETNGLMLGYYQELIEMLSPFKDFLFVRISIKGWDEKSFEKISGAKGEFFEYPLIALKKLREKGIHAWPAAMFDVFGRRGVETLRKRLKKFGIERIELEYLEKYPFVIENLRKRGIII